MTVPGVAVVAAWLVAITGDQLLADHSVAALVSGRLGQLAERGANNPVPLQLAGRISSGAASRYHLVAVSPLDLGGMLAADRP